MAKRQPKEPSSTAKKILCLSRDRSWIDLERAWGVSSTTIRAWSLGHGSPRAETVAKIAAIEGVDVADLLAPEPLPALSLGHGIAAAQRTIAEAEARVAAGSERPQGTVERFLAGAVSHDIGERAFLGRAAAYEPGEMVADVHDDLAGQRGRVIGDTRFVRVVGDSAEPVVREGQILVIDAQSRPPVPDHFYIVLLEDDGAYFKRFRRMDGRDYVFEAVGQDRREVRWDAVRIAAMFPVLGNYYSGVSITGDVSEVMAGDPPEDFCA